MPRRQLIVIAAATGVAWLAFVLVGQGGSDGEVSKGNGGRGTTISTISTTSTLAFDLPVHCEALALFSSATASLSESQDPVKLANALEVLSASLEDLGTATAHPDLVEQTEVLSPVVDEALQAVRTASPDDVAGIAQDPRFADPALIEASTEILSYELRCREPA